MAEAQFQPVGTGQQFKITQIAGYRVAGCFYPDSGIQNLFYVYVLERQDATNPFDPINLGDGENYPSGTLSLEVFQRKLTFSNIALLSVETLVSHRSRLRLLTFGYRIQGKDFVNAKFEYQNEKEIADKNKLGDNYKFSLDGKIKDSLLGLHSWLTPTEKVVLRLSSIPNREHDSWLKVIVDWNNDLANRTERKPFNLVVGQQQIKLTPESLVTVLVDESYGAMMSMPQPSVGYLYNSATPEHSLALSLRRDRPSDWVRQWQNRDFVGSLDDESESELGTSRRSVETVTIILSPQKYNNLNFV